MPDDHTTYHRSTEGHDPRRGPHGDQSPTAPQRFPDEEQQPVPDDAQGVVGGLPDARPDTGPPEAGPRGRVEPLDAEIVPLSELRQVISEFWLGPTPSPRTLREFKDVDASFAERAFAMSEQSVAASNHEKTVLASADADAIRRGQWMSFSLTIMFIAAAVGSLLLGSEVLAVVFLSPPAFQYLGKLIRTVRRQEDDHIGDEPDSETRKS